MTELSSSSSGAPSLPRIAILGAGPVGLEAALAAAERGWPFTVYEAAEEPAGSVRDWRHVRLFSPWDLNVSPRARKRLEDAGGAPPTGETCPTGGDLLEHVLEPLAALPDIGPNVAYGAKVVAVGRDGLVKSDEIGTGVRATRPFRLLIQNAIGGRRVDRADVVLDCSGAYDVPNSLGDGGIPAPGEVEAEGLGLLHRRIPDLADDEHRRRFAGQVTLLVGAGHSAQTAARDLASLAEEAPDTHILWALRRPEPGWQPIEDDALPERSRLIDTANELVAGGSEAVEVVPGVVVEAVRQAQGEGRELAVTLRDAAGDERVVEVDRILSLTGSVGDHTVYRQLQVHECYATTGPMKLAAALLGESSADCLAQSSHGADTLTNPEPGFFLLGAKSYGRNNTFLMRTGWQQVEEVFGLLDERQAA